MADDVGDAAQRWPSTRRMASARRVAVRCVGTLVIAGVLYVTLYTVLFCGAAMLYAKGVIVDVPWLVHIQRELYLNGGWNVWQAQPGCVEFDEKLIYKPSVGACRFDNMEFRTVVNFTATGRMMDPVAAPPGKAIAVLGDSFAMGWGVDDADTFSAELQRRTGRPVYNLAVSSYGTARELLRLSAFDQLDTVDTVIIQYCDNDREENLHFTVPSLAEAQRKFAMATGPRRSDRWFVFKYYYRAYKATIWYPIVEVFRRALHGTDPEDFRPHYDTLMQLLRNADVLKGKQVIVFYTRGYDVRFKNFPAGKDRELDNLTFVDIELDAKDFYVLDPHLNASGHKVIGERLAHALAAF
jgi:lysophospholipase L1-like esterase